MKFTEKLRLLTDGQNKARIGRCSGLGTTTISNYIAKGSMPRADIAVKMASALNVPIDWLCDDDRDWPPPSSTEPSAPASSAALAIGGGATLPGNAVTNPMNSVSVPVAVGNGSGAPLVLQPSDDLESTAVAIAARLVLAGNATDAEQAARKIVRVAKIILSIHQADTTKVPANPSKETLRKALLQKSTDHNRYRDTVIEATLARILARGKCTRRFAVMALNDSVFKAMCERIIDHKYTFDDIYQWIKTKIKNPPHRSSFYRFANVFTREHKSICSLRNSSSLPEKTA